ncbi:G-beta protein, transducin-like, putative [Theileria annulata]|uniref:G-beta protein, transducin-like, putative n=1 Tax=Theileria annulata TaxID=5874 RepID=Q4UF90_THEAN|nr:G-beta protein, transducin-like, putative [Theileria annulata]CAI74249.1 G-beta protein, transducin-like, putative [Theileria annulata]|eukprot:XP_951981.1 G-beta protein, transducin-like, putative [Theileria annulata]
MVKSYLRYIKEDSFGIFSSPYCKSIEFFGPDHILTSTIDYVYLYNYKLNEVKTKFLPKPDNNYNISTVTTFQLVKHHPSVNRFSRNFNDSSSHGHTSDEINYVFVGYYDGLIRRFCINSKINDGNPVNDDHILIGHKSRITVLKDTGNMIFSGSNDNNLFVWDVYNCQLLYKLLGHTNPIVNVLPISEDHVVTTCNNVMKVWDLHNQSPINTTIEPLLLYNKAIYFNVGFILKPILKMLFISFTNNNVIKCCKINESNEVELLFSVKTKYTNDKCVSVDYMEFGETVLLLVVFQKCIYVYKLLNSNEMTQKRKKRIRRLKQNIKAKINKLLKILRMVNHNTTYEEDNESDDLNSLKSKYNHLKNLLSNNLSGDKGMTNDDTQDNNVDSETNNQTDNTSEPVDTTMADEEVDEEGVAEEDYYKLLHIHNIKETVKSIKVNNRSIITLNTNNTVSLSRVSLEDDVVTVDLLYEMNMYHLNNINLVRISSNNKILLTFSNDKLILWNINTNNIIKTLNLTNINSSSNTSCIRPATSETSTDHDDGMELSNGAILENCTIINVIFINNENLLVVTSDNMLYKFNINTMLASMLNLKMDEDFISMLGTNNTIKNVYIHNDELVLIYKYNFIVKYKNDFQYVNLQHQIHHSLIDAMHKYMYLSVDNNVVIYYYDTMRKHLMLYGHSLLVTSLDATSDVQMLATSSLDKTIKLWSIKYGNILKTITNTSLITQVKFINMTHYLIFVNANMVLKIYDCDRHLMITEINDFNLTINNIALTDYNQYLFLTSNNSSCIIKYKLSDDIIYVEEETEKIENIKTFGNLNYNLNLLEEETTENGISQNNINIGGITYEGMGYNTNIMLYNVLNNINHNLMEFITNLLEHSDSVDCYMLNAEILLYVSIVILQINLKYYLLNNINVYKLKKLVNKKMNSYQDLILYNKSGLQHIKNIITNNEKEIKKRLI